MALAKKVSQKRAAVKSPAPAQNPEINKMIDDHIEQHPKRFAYLKGLTKERLIRRIALSEVKREQSFQKYREKEDTAIRAFLKKNPDIAEKVEAKLKLVPDDNKEAVRMQLGRRAAAKSALNIA